jgi:hypothetical protein
VLARSGAQFFLHYCSGAGLWASASWLKIAFLAAIELMRTPLEMANPRPTHCPTMSPGGDKNFEQTVIPNVKTVNMRERPCILMGESSSDQFARLRRRPHADVPISGGPWIVTQAIEASNRLRCLPGPRRLEPIRLRSGSRHHGRGRGEASVRRRHRNPMRKGENTS